MGKLELRQMADRAKRRLTEYPDLTHVHYRLSGGMELVIERRGRGWRLAAARHEVYPSGVELMILRNAFGVPYAAEEKRSVKKSHITYFIVEMEWIDILKPEQAELL